jgi:hypothetical protein
MIAVATSFRDPLLCAAARMRPPKIASSETRSLFFSSVCSNRIAVQVDSRLHFLRRRHLIPGGQHGEEEKEGSGEEDEASEEEVRVLPLWNLRQPESVGDCFAPAGAH